jgi:tRNA pseudouridine38-40 synthase
MSVNIKLLLAYDGTGYLGWQKTKEGPSIEEALQLVLETILQEKVLLQAASRTDAGVHALGQVVNFSTKKDLDLDKFQLSLNSLLPKEIVVREVEVVAEKFHPTLDCEGKTYEYRVCAGRQQLPVYRLYSWHFRAPLDLKAMLGAANELVGVHDFSAFCNVKKNETYADYVREVKSIEIYQEDGDRFIFFISGNHFLYKMVRNIVGTLVYVGCGKMRVEEIRGLLEGKDRTKIGVTAPAHGLTLKEVFFGHGHRHASYYP